MGHDNIDKINHKDLVFAKKIHAIFQRSYRIEAELIGVEDFPPLRRTVNNFQNSTTQFFGFIKNKALAAVIEVNVDDRQLEICSLVVDPAFFRQGIAGKMMEYVLENFPRNVSIVETAAVNKPAIALYEKFGFLMTRKWMLEIGIKKVRLCIESE